MDEVAAFALSLEGRQRWPWLGGACFELSEPVLANTTRDLGSLHVKTVDGRPLSRLLRGRREAYFDTSFTLFGPDYGPRRARTTIVGFADGTSLTPETTSPETVHQKIRGKIRRNISRRRFKHADSLVVEANHVAHNLATRWGIDEARIYVVPNVLNGVFQEVHGEAIQHLDQILSPPSASNSIRLCYPSRLYPHKNIQIMGRAAKALSENYGLSIQLLLTLTDSEFAALDPMTQSISTTVGPLRVAQMPSLYKACDATVFVSLNESFSITPLEAMSSGSPLIASDREFVHEIAGDAAGYCDPLDPNDIARALSGLVTQPEITARRIASGHKIVENWPSAKARTERYLDIIAQNFRP
ncbi:glycosyltransferase [Janibacter cremeus]|nr:glycosyltransferase [Janibacter cremeus]